MAKKAKETGSVVDTEKYQYDRIKIAGADGKVRHSASNNDAVARALLVHLAGGADIMKVVRANKLQDKMKEHEGKNAGLFRMILGHALRGLVRNGTPVEIGAIMVKKLDQKVAVPEVKDKAAPRKRKAAAA